MKFATTITTLSLTALTVFACQKQIDNPPPDNKPTVYTPINISAKPGFRLDTLAWEDTNKVKSGFKVYRDSVLIGSTTVNSFIDTGLLLKRKYSYQITTFNTSSESMRSTPVSVISDSAKVIMCALFVGRYQFPTATKLETTVTFLNNPTNWDGSPNKDGWYVQIYSGGSINDTIGWYFGFQTRLQDKPGVSSNPPKRGFIFSRWSTRDLANTKPTTDSGWAVSAGTEGDFIGVRRYYDWGPGTYTFTVNKDSSDKVGDWYSIWVNSKSRGSNTYMGSMRFEYSSKGSGIKSGGGAFLEQYYREKQLPNPNWNITFDKILADGVPIAHANGEYGQETIPSNISYRDGLIHMDLGYWALRMNNAGPLY